MGIDGIVAGIYGILSAVGGIIGYRQAGSLPSMISGLISGALLIIGGVAIALAGQSWGYILAIAVTALLVAVFFFRLIKTKRFMPAGLMLSTGIITLIVLTQ